MSSYEMIIFKDGECVESFNLSNPSIPTRSLGETIAYLNREEIGFSLYDENKNQVIVIEDDVYTEEINYLNERLNMMTEMLNKVKDGIYITDERGKTLYVNDVFLDLSGLKREELLGKSVYDLRDDEVLPNSCCAKVIDTKRPVDTINNYYEGQRCLVSGSPIFNEEGELKRTIAVIRDVSELDFLMKKVSEADNKHLVFTKEIQADIIPQKAMSSNKEMKRVFEMANRMSFVDTTILILGETGAGKDFLAEYIHNQSKKKNGGKFIKVNCGAIPEHLLESELFGYVDGAFTGAKKGGKKGLFEEAENGTLFLDEIGDMPYTLQVKLLNVLNDHYFYKIGGTTQVKFKGRIVAATNADLNQLVDEKRFRKDLYYRLNVVSFKVPPLRDRKEDIMPLSRMFLEHYNQLFNRMCYMTKEALEVLYIHDWPGNIRELKNLVERMVLMSDNDNIDSKSLMSFINLEESDSLEFSEQSTLKDRMAAYERFILEETISKSSTLAEAAKNLNIDLSTLVRKKKKYEL